MTGRSGIGVLVAGFSRVGALKKHAPLVFNLSRNISPNATKVMYLHRPMSSNRYVSRFYEQSSEWTKLMKINSTAQPIETHGKLAGIFP